MDLVSMVRVHIRRAGSLCASRADMAMRVKSGPLVTVALRMRHRNPIPSLIGPRNTTAVTRGEDYRMIRVASTALLCGVTLFLPVVYAATTAADAIIDAGVEDLRQAQKLVPSNKGDASFTYELNRWSAGIWVKKMTNRAVIAATEAAGIPGPAAAYLEDPRTFGAIFSVKY